MTTKPTTKDEPEVLSGDDVKAFTDADARQSGGDIVQYINQGIAGIKVGETGIVSYDEATADSNRPPLVDKVILENQPFVVLNVNVLPDAAKNPETGELSDLVMVAAQAVKLDGNNQVTRGGRVVIFTAGNDASVLGSEMTELARVASPTSPVLIKSGLQRKTAIKGDYHTVRGKVVDTAFDLFPD